MPRSRQGPPSAPYSSSPAFASGSASSPPSSIAYSNPSSSAPKRKAVDAILLSDDDDDDDDEPPPSTFDSAKRGKKHQKTAPASGQVAVPQAWDDEDDARAQEVIDLTQQERDGENLISYGVVNVGAKIVGVQYYSGQVSPGEQVLFRREPHNQYDRNAIRVDNVLNQQVGHIPRVLAAKLAPLLDRGIIHLEGTICGLGVYEYPLKLELFGEGGAENQARIKQAITDAGVKLKKSEEEKERERREKEAAKRRAEEEKRRKKNKKIRIGKGGAPPTGQADEEIEINENGEFVGNMAPSQKEKEDLKQTWESLVGGSEMLDAREVGNAVERFGISQEDLAKMPSAKQPQRLATPLLPYQLQGLAWMLQKEHPQLPKSGDDIQQLWKKKGDLYQNIATMFSTKKPVMASGGVLADDMGLGKTLQVISLITANVKQEQVLVPMPKVDEKACTGGTLIVAPVSVMSNWTDQIEFHVGSAAPLRVFRYHGPGRAGVKMGDYDVVITSYGTLTSEHNPKQKPGAAKKGLFNVNWRRVVLDEAHGIRNPKSKAALACSSLEAASRWALTGTPIVNELKDLYSLLKFLRWSGGLAEYDLFNRVLIRPLSRGVPEASNLLQILMATLCLRRTKEMKFVDLKLPPIQELIHKVELTPDERKKYEVLELEAKGLLDRVTKGKTADNSGKDEYRFLLEILLRMRQLCCHQSLCGERLQSLMALAGQTRVALTNENIGLLQDVLQLAIDAQEECPICLDILHNPRITVCKHVFGLECIEKVIETQKKCPMCRCELADLQSSTVEPMTIEDPTVSKNTEMDESSSSKIEAMIQILKASAAKTPGTKTVIFSQWTSFLNLFEPHLTRAGITFTRIDGSMTALKRDAAIKEFGNEPGCTVLLASLAIANVGLNLVMANQVIVSAPWWAPAIEQQACDRVYRLGQTRPVTVWKIVVANSIEERVIGIQEKKKQLVETAFREKSKRGMGSNNMGDVAALLA